MILKPTEALTLIFYSGGSTPPPPAFLLEHDGTLAEEEKDFRLQSSIVSLPAGQNETEVVLLILDDSEPEGPEVFFIYLTNAQGGAQIADRPYQGFGAFAKITILGKSQLELTAKCTFDACLGLLVYFQSAVVARRIPLQFCICESIRIVFLHSYILTI